MASKKKKTIRQWLVGDFSVKRLMASVLFIYAFLVLYGILFSDRLLFRPPPSSYSDTPEILKLTVKNGQKISAIYLPNPSATYTLLYSHGNAEDLGDNQFHFQELRDRGFAIFAYDYQGYGTSQGKPSEGNTYQDIDAAYDYLTSTLKVPPQRIIAYGRSVGSGPTVDLAARKPVAAVILETPFITAFRVITRIPILPFDKFDNLSKIKKIRVPLLIIHGTADRVVPFWHGQALFQAANPPKRFLRVEQGDHNDLVEVAGALYTNTLKEFAAEVKQLNPPPD
ncbi:MAG: alpha/beta hydrolase [Leptolyngbyaceae bacterium]|nr:alpha/beta hydrolase [Leptolyngbyaceae bacterium]